MRCRLILAAMTSRKRLWILVGALGALLSCIVYLARPEDEMANVKKFRSRIYAQNRVIDPDDRTDPGNTLYLFRASPEDVRAIMPGLNPSVGAHVPFPMLGGRTAVLTRLGHGGPSAQEEWSIVVDGDDRPWYQSALFRVRSRIGL